MSASRRSFLAPPAAHTSARPPPTFSVIIAAYQAADTIGGAVGSALDQTTAPSEVIVCDDGSTDDLEGALAPFRERVVLLRQPNGGAASARNRALRAASGEFVASLDSDDVLLPEYLEALGELASARPDLDLLSTDAYFDVAGEVVGRFYKENRFATEDQRTAILTGCFVGWPAVRRERFVALGGFHESLKIAYDWDAWIRLILAGGRAGLVTEPLLRYRLRPGSLSADRVRSLRERVTVLDRTLANPNLRPEEAQKLQSARREAATRALAEEAGAGTPRRVWASRGTRLNTLPRLLEKEVGVDYLGRPVSLREAARRRARRIRRPRALALRRTRPLSERWGTDRGTPIDRYYIERFLARNRHAIQGSVLEIKQSVYTDRFGSGVGERHVLDSDATNERATIVTDLARADAVASNSFDCFILTQTLQFIYDLHSAVTHCHRILRPGGVLLCTMPSVSRIEPGSLEEEYWRFTGASCTRLFGGIFGAGNIEVRAHGNVLTSIAFLTGLAQEELRGRQLDHDDDYFPLLVTVRAHKAVEGA